jgi:hypothetical protein
MSGLGQAAGPIIGAASVVFRSLRNCRNQWLEDLPLSKDRAY